LQWDIGHVFAASEADPTRICGKGAGGLPSPGKFDQFSTKRGMECFSSGEDLPGQALATQRVVWSGNFSADPRCRRYDSISGVGHMTAIAVPIVADGDVLAVLEFATERFFPSSAYMARIFEILGFVVGNIVMRQRARRLESQHIAALLNASRLVTLGEIAAGVGHEISSPLSAIALTTQVLKRGIEQGGVTENVLEEQVTRLERCIERVNSIVSNLQHASRDASKDPFVASSIREIIAETLSLCRARLARRQVNVIVGDIPEDWKAECRPSQVSQVLLNLINNAYDAVVSEKAQWIRVQVEEGADCFDFVVSDSGPKIPREISDKMMNMFFTTKPPGKGTGLGLSISHDLMKIHGGKLLFVEEAPHTSFMARLPKKQGMSRGPSAVQQLS